MYEPQGYSAQIFRERYAFTETETWSEACRRVAQQVAKAEVPDKVNRYTDEFYKILVENLFVCGGRIWYGSGHKEPNLLNCFALGKHIDSKEGWGKITSDTIITSMSGGGCGCNLSDIRPNGAEIGVHRGKCPGPLRVANILNGSGDEVRSGGGRRAAFMFALSLAHPDINDFLNAKLVQGRWNNANISVLSYDTTKFIDAVKKNSGWELSWKGRYKKTVDAAELWNTIVTNSWKSAEPGFLNWEFVLDESTVSYFVELLTTNPCVSGDTEILTKKGYQRIDSLINSCVEVWNGFEWSKVEPKVTGTNQEMLKVTLSSGQELVCTKYHTFHIVTDYMGTTVKKIAQNLKIGDKIIKHHYPVIEQGVEVEKKEAYTQGFYSGDGNSGEDTKTLWLYTPKFCCTNRLSARPPSVPNDSKMAYHLIAEPKSKNFVPFNWGLSARLEWMSGILDSDGTELKEGGSQISSADKTFLLDIQKMLTTMGVTSKVRKGKEACVKAMPDGRGGFKNYPCQISWRLLIGATQIQFLKTLGMNCSRLKFDKNPQRDATQFVTIENIEAAPIAEKVYCFTEPKRHLGCFNGIVTGNCGEQPLEPYGACDLGHLVLPRFVKNGALDYDLLSEVIFLAVRFLDDVLDVNHFPLIEMKNQSQNTRRIGLGRTGLADAAAMCGLRYGSPEFLKWLRELYSFVREESYHASILLATEKGMFPLCQPEEHVRTGYCKRLPVKIKRLIKEHGIRNCAVLTEAPVGTGSILSGNITSGIESMIAPAYERTYRSGEENKTELVFHPLFKQMVDEGKDTKHFVAAHELTIREHMEVQAVIQEYVDAAVSKTINMPANQDIAEMSTAWLEYLPRLKGTTFYRDGSRGKAPLQPLAYDEAIARIAETSVDYGVKHCPGGKCDL